MTENIIKLPEVIKRTGCSRATIYRLISKSAFPRSVLLTGRAVGWVESEVDCWIQGRIQGREKVALGKKILSSY